jgi:hypothetical protein
MGSDQIGENGVFKNKNEMFSTKKENLEGLRDS